jgi:uncharacterized SAM-binding protein YcdF (DUF218 family)
VSRRWRWSALLVAALVAVPVVAGYPVYVRPQVDAPTKADAILVVGGAAPVQRYRYAFELAGQGWAPHLVVSDPDGEMAAACARRWSGFTVECFSPDPRTTLGEARELGRLAAERHWRTVIVVTYLPHVSRARYILGRCFTGRLIMAPSPTHLSATGWAWMYVYQTAGYVKTLFQGGC